MANVRKKISELTALTSASLDTVIVGVDNGTTYKIELDVLADAVTSRVNILDRSRLSSLESVTSSFETKGRSVISSSAQITAFGFTSSSANLTSLNSFTSSQSSINTAFTNGINSRLTTSSFESFSSSVHSEILAATNEQNLSYLVNTSSFNSYTASVSNRIGDVENQISSSISYVYVKHDGVQTSPPSGEFFKPNYNISGSIPYDVSSGYFTLLAGKTYLLRAAYSFYDDNSNESTHGWFDVTHNTYLNAYGNYPQPIAETIITPNINIQVGVKNGRLGTPTIDNSTSYILIQELALGIVEGITGSTDYTQISNKPTLISGSSQLTSSFDGRYLVTGSITSSINQLNTFTASISTASLVNRLNLIESVSGSWITESETGSFLTSLNGAISSSNQLTSSFDERYALSGSVVSGTTPAGTISGSSQLTASFDTRYLNAGGDGVWSGSAQVTGNLAVTSVSASVFVGGYLVPEAKFTVLSSKPMTFWPNISYELVRMTTGGGVLIGRNGETNDYGNRLDVSGSVRFTGNTTITGSLITTQGFTGSIAATNGVVSGSSQLTSSFDGRYTLSGSVQPLPNGVISGSSQLTASFDTRYALSGSGGGTIPTGTISGSTQISAFGFVSGSYVTTSSFNSFTASAQTVTTGSNSFNGTQTITGSLIITTGSFVGSQILANTSSLYLTSGSNMYVQNNGVVEITGSLVVSGSVNIVTTSPLQIGTGSGDEGGEILLAKAATNSTLTGTGITIDSYRDRLRIFEQGGDARGVYIDLSKAPTGVSGELMWKASGFVNAGTYVTLDNIKATLTSSGNRGLSIAAVSSTFTATYAGTFNNTGGAGGNSSNGTISVTTTPTTSLFGWNFAGQGDLSTFVLSDITNNRAYRITLQIGGSYLNNFIMIERLH